jgi:hypothetical protein
VADPLKARARNIKCMISYSSKDCVDRVCKSLLALAEICPVVTMRLDRNFPAHDNTVDGQIRSPQLDFILRCQARSLDNRAKWYCDLIVQLDLWMPRLVI